MWHLSENGKPQGQFDIIIIAHNGKCANRLLGSSGLPLIARQMKRLELSSIWALLAAFEDPLPIADPEQFEGAFENIPNATAEKVKTGMFGGIEAALGLSKGSLPRPFYSKLQLWGAALPTNTPGVPCIFDPHGRAGICGDWLLGSSVESAAVSGMALANHVSVE
ncbi:hypothetical protein Q3G72_001239 [Acer saccharum]|nr:hypothetical protein Q3G72_001239 [Acer saccharum]